MTTFILLRHAKSTANNAGILAGRNSGIELNTQGRKDAKRLVKYLADLQIDRIFSSPLERCISTAQPFASAAKKRIKIEPSLIEMDYGSWSGRNLKELQKLPEWKTIQSTPSSFTFPRGESFTKAQKRVARTLHDLARKYPKDRILIVSHGDIIKLATAYALKIELDNFQRIVIDPASLTIIEWNERQQSLVQLNSSALGRAALSIKGRIRPHTQRTMLGGGAGV